MSILPFGSPKQSRFELGRRPHLESVETLTAAAPFGTLESHHDIAEILLVEKGHCRMRLKEGSQQLRTEDLVLINSDTLHDFKTSSSFMGFTMRIGALHLCGLAPGHLTKHDTPLVLHLSKEGRHAFLRDLLREIGAALTQAIVVAVTALAEAKATSEENPSYTMGTRIKEYIDAHYLEDLKLPDIAEALHINLYYLSHTFKDLTGSSPMQYIIRKRIEEAQTLLLTTNMTITDIAMQCGYNNSNYFQSVFSNIVGMPPGKYRKTWAQ